MAELIARGHSRRTIARAIERGSLFRICRGWVATAAASQDSILAILNGGKLTSSSALASRGTWDGHSSRLHVRVPANSPRTRRIARTPISRFVPLRHQRVGVTRHWVKENAPDPREPAWRVSTIDALLQASKHLPGDQFVACVDSAIHEGTLSRAGLPILESLLSPARRPLLRTIDPAAESGLESLARLRLVPIVNRLETQVRIPGIAANGGTGRVDLLVDGWLVIELDGDEWHDPRSDRLRDGVLVRRGYRSHRFGYDQVIDRWPETEATVVELLRYRPDALTPPALHPSPDSLARPARPWPDAPAR